MAEIIKNRTIRPSTRKQKSIYRIHTSKLLASDTLIININHEKNEFQITYKFKGIDIYPRKSIHFKVNELNDKIEIDWYNNLIPIK